jgi:hypothetical protein
VQPFQLNPEARCAAAHVWHDCSSFPAAVGHHVARQPRESSLPAGCPTRCASRISSATHGRAVTSTGGSRTRAWRRTLLRCSITCGSLEPTSSGSTWVVDLRCSSPLVSRCSFARADLGRLPPRRDAIGAAPDDPHDHRRDVRRLTVRSELACRRTQADPFPVLVRKLRELDETPFCLARGRHQAQRVADSDHRRRCRRDPPRARGRPAAAVGRWGMDDLTGVGTARLAVQPGTRTSCLPRSGVLDRSAWLLSMIPTSSTSRATSHPALDSYAGARARTPRDRPGRQVTVGRQARRRSRSHFRSASARLATVARARPAPNVCVCHRSSDEQCLTLDRQPAATTSSRRVCVSGEEAETETISKVSSARQGCDHDITGHRR